MLVVVLLCSINKGMEDDEKVNRGCTRLVDDLDAAATGKDLQTWYSSGTMGTGPENPGNLR